MDANKAQTAKAETQAAPHKPVKRSVVQSMRNSAKWLVDRIFPYSKLEEMQKELRLVSRRVEKIERSVEDSFMLLDKKIQYLLAKIDAYADVEDRNSAALSLELGEQRAALLNTEEKIKKALQKTAFNEFRQRESLDALLQSLNFRIPLPATRGWAASPDFLLHIYTHILTHKPRLVVELGSGVSSLVAAAALAASGKDGRLYCMEHDDLFAKTASELLVQHGFTATASVHHAPLRPWRPDRPTALGEEWQWYSVPDAIRELNSIDLLIVDGPPEASGPYARYPAVPYFRPRMAPQCVILLDDARRPDERIVAETWSQENSLGLKLLLREDYEFEKGLAVLTADQKLSGGDAQK